MPRLGTAASAADAHGDAVWCARWAPGGGGGGGAGGGGAVLATGAADESVKVWGLGPGGDALTLEHTSEGIQLGVVALAVDAAGKYAAFSGLDSVVRVLDWRSLKQVANINLPPSESWGVAFAPGAAGLLAVAAGSAGGAGVYRVGGGGEAEKVATLAPPPGPAKGFAMSVAYSPDGGRLAVGGGDGTVGVYDVGTGALLHTLASTAHAVRSLDWTPEGRYLLTASDDNALRLYDAEHADLIQLLGGHENWALGAAFTPDGQAFASCGADKTVKLWEWHTRACVQTVEHADIVWDVDFSPDGKYLAAVSEDKSVSVYTVA